MLQLHVLSVYTKEGVWVLKAEHSFTTMLCTVWVMQHQQVLSSNPSKQEVTVEIESTLAHRARAGRAG